MYKHIRLEFLAAAAFAGVAAVSAQSQPQEPAASASREREVSDAQLGLEARARLFEELGVSNLSVLVDHGVATVDGTVRSDEDRRRAEALVLEVEGIERVVNELNVADRLTLALADEAAAATDRDNANVETSIAERLNADAALGSRSIEVVADELTNTVTLRGTVSSEEEKERAGQIAVTAYPGGNVRNQIEVQQRL